MSEAPDSGPASAGGRTASAFDPRVIGALIIAGLLAFIAFWVLSAFAPQLAQGRDGGAHALSRSATSYSAIVELLRASGTSVDIERDTAARPGLLILTPPATTNGVDLLERIDAHGGQPILVVLPKWIAVPHGEQRGWVHRGALLSDAPMLAGDPFNLTFRSRSGQGGTLGSAEVAAVQVIEGQGLSTIVPSADGGAVVARINARPNVMILADADLIANHGVATPARAASAVALIRTLAAGGPVQFDVVLNGYGSGRSLLALAFTPPFLGLTLCLLMAGLLALLAGFVRFGPPLQDGRPVAFGKAALVANSARLIVQAGRVQHFAATYAEQVRHSVARRMHAPTTLSGSDLDLWLDRLGGRDAQTFTRLAAALTAANSSTEAVARARALGQWRKDVLRGHF